MTSTSGRDRRTLTAAAVLALTLAACAADKKPPMAPEAAPPPSSGGAPAEYPAQPSQPGYPAPPGHAPQQPGGDANKYAPPPPPPQPTTPTMPATTPGDDFDRAERELSVAAGDCNNACRALGSMDRAAGNICKLSQDKPRCDDATSKVRTARDKVKNSCGECKETSTDRNAPVPSR